MAAAAGSGTPPSCCATCCSRSMCTSDVGASSAAAWPTTRHGFGPAWEWHGLCRPNSSAHVPPLLILFGCLFTLLQQQI